jgi:hypothetical protein
MNRLYIISAILIGSLLSACGSDKKADAGQAAATESQAAPAPPPPAEPKVYGPPSEATFYHAKHDMGFDYDTTLWMLVPADKLEGLFDLIARGKPTPTFQVLGGLMLRANAGQELQHPVVSFGVDVLQGPAPTLEDARRQSGAASYPLKDLQKDLPAHFREERFPRPLVDHQRNALYMKTLGSFKPSEETQIMQAIFLSSDKLPFLHLAFPNDAPKDYHRQFAAMVESFRRGS